MKTTTLLMVLLIAALSSSVYARDLKTKDGKIYKNISISAVTPIGIDIAYKKNNTTFIQLIRFSNLSEEQQKEFAYNPEKAKNYITRIKKHVEASDKTYENKLKKETKEDIADEELASRIEAGRINAVLKVKEVKNDGIIAIADNLDQNLSYSSGHMGKVFIYRLLGMSGAEEARIIYPVGIRKYGLPCYAPTLELAILLSKQNTQ